MRHTLVVPKAEATLEERISDRSGRQRRVSLVFPPLGSPASPRLLRSGPVQGFSVFSNTLRVVMSAHAKGYGCGT
jgi:hypothetical protein